MEGGKERRRTQVFTKNRERRIRIFRREREKRCKDISGGGVEMDGWRLCSV